MSSLRRFTVFGHKGFVGSNLVKYLRNRNVDIILPERTTFPEGHLGHVVYCIGLTADFRTRLFDTIDAHVCCLSALLRKINFSSFLYLSSTRVYSGLPTDEVATENSPVMVRSQNLQDLYNLSKLLGESICLTMRDDRVRVLRLSNVYGKDMGRESFLGNILEQAVVHKKVIIHQAKEVKKDYVFVGDVVKLIYEISISAKHRLYNIAIQEQISHEELGALLQDIGIPVIFGKEKGPLFPVISNQRVVTEFGYDSVSRRTKLKEIFFDIITESK